MTGFEGSYMGAADKISPQAIMECKICWTPYDPADGDDTRQIEPGTPFTALPEDWSCPNCGAPAEQFLVFEDPGSEDVRVAAMIDAKTEALVTDFREVWHSKMRDVPLVNKALQVQAVGFHVHDGRPLGVLISPWFMNLIQLPAEAEDWTSLTPGAKEQMSFPSGEYEFIHNTREMTGGYKACSLFSPMGDFTTQAQAVDVARAVMIALFRAEHRAETDRAADIRASREAEIAVQQADETDETAGGDDVESKPPSTPTRRQVVTAGLSGEAG